MAPGIFERIQARIELFRLEQRYTKRRNRRSTFVSNAMYVDGEYIYNTPASTGSSTNSSSPNTATAGGSALTTEDLPPPSPSPADAEKSTKKLHRFSSMPGFGSLSKTSGRPATADWRGENSDVAAMR